MIRRWTIAVGLLLALGLGGAAHAFGPDEPMPDPVLETRARAISKELRCVVCQNQSIDESNADLAKAMRELVRERLKMGDSDSEVIGALEARYGDFVRLMPPFKATTAMLWAAPALLLGFGLLAWRRAFRRKAAEAVPEAVSLPPGEAAALPGAGVLAAAAGVAVVLAAGAYLILGHPGTPDQPVRPRLAERLGVSETAIAEMQTMAEQIETRLAAAPDDARAWLMLGRADRDLGRHAEAIAALRRAIQLGEADGEVYGDLGESLAFRDRAVTAEAADAFARAARLAPGEPRAAFFLGLQRAEAGDLAAAEAIWRAGAEAQPRDSAWARRLGGQADRAAALLAQQKP